MTPLKSSTSRRRLLVAALVAVTAAVATAASTVQPARAAFPTLQVWLTTADGSTNLAQQSNVTLGPVSRGAINVAVDDSRSYQTISGFGAAFTDSSTLLMSQLKSYNQTTYNTMMNDLFSTSSGIGLAYWRLPMTASDFNSTNTPWTADDVQGPSNNPTQNFGLTAQDTGHVIPVVKDALAINSNVKLLASPWSPPAWMKSNGSMICNTGGGNASLLSADYQPWADYFVKWINAYQANGVPIWGITPQNEPLYCPTNYPGSSWDPAGEASWVHSYLKPSLTNAGLSPVILGFDHNWDALYFPQQLATSSAAGDLSGMAWHCYDNNSEPTQMSAIHNQYGGDQYETECSSDTSPTDIIPYTTASMALLSVQNWAKGVILWNAALNSSNGPHLGGCTSCVPVVTIDTTTDGSGHVTSASYSRRNNYYQLGQLSKFVAVGATHIASTVTAHGVITAAFKNPNGQEALVATNPTTAAITFEVTWNGQGSFSYTLPSKATVTVLGTVAAAPSTPTTPRSGQTYRIVNHLSGKPIGVYAASTSNGGQIVQWTHDSDADQQWTLLDAGNGYYNIINVNSGLALDDTNGSTANGTQMQQWALVNGSSNQQWQINSAGNGYYTLINRTSSLALDLNGGGLGDGVAIQQWGATNGNLNQQWQLIGTPRSASAVTPAAGGSYRIVNQASGKPLGIAGASTADGAHVVGSADDAALDQVWTLVDAGGGYFNLIDSNSGKGLDDTGGSTTNGTQMQQWTIAGTGNSNQQWQITSLGNGYYKITSRTSGLVLDLTNGNTDDGTAIQQWAAGSNNPNQGWQFVPAK
ncbi:MAG: RICIN domain-containing protein [Gaiellaceae bacterium]